MGQCDSHNTSNQPYKIASACFTSAPTVAQTEKRQQSSSLPVQSSSGARHRHPRLLTSITRGYSHNHKGPGKGRQQQSGVAVHLAIKGWDKASPTVEVPKSWHGALQWDLGTLQTSLKIIWVQGKHFRQPGRQFVTLDTCSASPILYLYQCVCACSDRAITMVFLSMLPNRHLIYHALLCGLWWGEFWVGESSCLPLKPSLKQNKIKSHLFIHLVPRKRKEKAELPPLWAVADMKDFGWGAKVQQRTLIKTEQDQPNIQWCWSTFSVAEWRMWKWLKCQEGSISNVTSSLLY